MEISQLSELAVSVRAYLDSVSIEIGRSQSLDAIAAIPGLRNWPEVKSFPARVAAAKLDMVSVGRLAYRLEHKYHHKVEAPELLSLLMSRDEPASVPAPDVWPTGPAPGVYLARDSKAIEALVSQYADATDGGLIYSESVGLGYDGAIWLGEDGLWSGGLTRVPSGTLIVVGPVRFDQESWDDAKSRVGTACDLAVLSGHRVAVVVQSPDVDNIAADACLLARSWASDDDEGDPDEDISQAIIGWVSKEGNLVADGVRREWKRERAAPAVRSSSMFPPNVVDTLKSAFERPAGGIFVFGSRVNSANPGVELVESALALTERFGPAVRILPRHRGTMEKFKQVPDAVAHLPFLPSVESAYAQGYRRFVIDPSYTKGEVVTSRLNDSVFLMPTLGADVESMTMAALHLHRSWATFLEHLLAVVAITPLSAQGKAMPIFDVYVRPHTPLVVDGTDGVILDFPVQNRVLRQEDQLASLIAGGVDVSSLEVQGADARVGEHLVARLLKLQD